MPFVAQGESRLFTHLRQSRLTRCRRFDFFN